MKTKILSGLICCLGIFSANAQTITAPVGQPLTITNAVDVTGGGLNILTDTEFKIGGKKVISNKGTLNLFLGENSGQSIGAGTDNFFGGNSSGFSNTSGNYNSFLGSKSGYSNTTGSNNSFIGTSAGYSNTTGADNFFAGTGAGFANTTGVQNMFLGTTAGYSNTTGSSNMFFGASAGVSNTTGVNNGFYGIAAGLLNTTGFSNLFFGTNSGGANTTGARNIMIGTGAGGTNTTGNDNTYIGNGAVGTATLSNVTAIGANSSVSSSNTVVLGNAATTITGQGLAAGVSGLRFANLNASSVAVASGGSNKVLSVDGSGNVVLVALAGGVTTTATNPVAESTWKNADGYLYNNSTNGVVINGAGLDGNALIVKGGVLSKEVNVKVEGAESWPDYVFKPSYKRMSLEEVEKFISINGHLPNVASATEMAATGNNLNKTDIKLLEKVEELTLYLLDMKKANDAQSAEIQSLKNQMNKLKKNRK